MKSLRILLTCSLVLTASASLVRAEHHDDKKPDATPVEKKDDNKADKEGCCSDGCAKPEKKDEKKP